MLSFCNKSSISEQCPVFSIDWTIENFFSYTEEIDVSYYSPQFSVLDTSWRLLIYPNGSSLDDCAAGWVFLNLRNESYPPPKGSFNFGIKTADGRIEKMGEQIEFESMRCLPRVPQKLLESSKLWERQSELVPSGSLTLTCSIRLKHSLRYLSGLIELSSDIERMRFLSYYPDLTVRVKNEDFRVHKSVLLSRSPVLAAELDIKDESNEKEKESKKEEDKGITVISDCDSEVFNYFLMYLYGGTFANYLSHAKILELCKIAFRYESKELMEECLLFLADNLYVDNVIDVIILTEKLVKKYSTLGTVAVDVRSKIQNFFSNHYVEIFDTAKWDTFAEENPDLAEEMYESIAKEMKEKKWNKFFEKITK